ncbi:probable E3 ubiquitin-protein ligase HIP1 [Spinacia oleracea]|uniref:RING-type E3 ubiquitin transferase n=1 Tax=Spinacia oleracea TaxID=3562 RepID=A0ABM3RUU3_SPIOL|nr:probable E3 ubiquitin-protein ligase HIP1 [Spinacia oleracea]
MHRDLRLDVDNMSYEELLALGEEIGNVRTGFNKETITKFLKRKVYGCDVENPISEPDTCCICREDYVEGEDIGELNFRHEFHADCIEQWLTVKYMPDLPDEGAGSGCIICFSTRNYRFRSRLIYSFTHL